MNKMQKKQRLRYFIELRPRGIITRLAEYVGTSTVSVHTWLDDEKGWMTRKNEKLVEEFMKQTQAEEEAAGEAARPLEQDAIAKEKEGTHGQDQKEVSRKEKLDLTRAVITLLTEYVSIEDLRGVIGEVVGTGTKRE